MEEPTKNVKEIIEAATGLVKAVPIYEDAIQPAAKEIGKTLQLVAKAVNVALSPISGLIWGYEKIGEFIDKYVSEKLLKVAEENIITPDPAVVGPALEALRFVGNNQYLREMYANLIANSMDSETSSSAHPAFVDIIKNITPDEARIMKFMTTNGMQPLINIYFTAKTYGTETLRSSNLMSIDVKLDSPDYITVYISNLLRLGLLTIPAGQTLSDQELYQPIMNSLAFLKFVAKAKEEDLYVKPEKLSLTLTSFGEMFSYACITEKASD